MMELFDSHCHMIDHKFDTDRDDAIARMLEKGVTRYAEIGTDMESSRQVADFAACHKGCYAVVGIHPHEAKTMKDGDLDLLAAWLKEEKVVALGEIGLDYYYDFSPREVQIDVCEKQMELAWQLNVPVAYHVRDAHQDMLDLMKRHKGKLSGGIIPVRVELVVNHMAMGIKQFHHPTMAPSSTPSPTDTRRRLLLPSTAERIMPWLSMPIIRRGFRLVMATIWRPTSSSGLG